MKTVYVVSTGHENVFVAIFDNEEEAEKLVAWEIENQSSFCGYIVEKNYVYSSLEKYLKQEEPFSNF